MFISILCLLLLFVAGIVTTTNIFTKKKFFAWFQSLNSLGSTLNNNSSHGAEKAEAVGENKGKKTRSISSASSEVSKSKDELRSVFATFDKNRDGFINRQELRASLRNIGIVMEEKDIDDIVKNIDSNGDGLIDLDEFCDSFASLLGREDQLSKDEASNLDNHDEEEDKEEDLKEAFDVFDGDRDGLITVEELGLVLSSLGFREGKMLEDCKEMINKVDIDGDGMVNFNEFKTMMKDGSRFIPVA